MFNTVVNLVCNPAKPVLTQRLIADIADFVDGWAINGVEKSILAEGIAADIFFAPDDKDKSNLPNALSAQLEGAQIDITLLPVEGRQKKLLIADMDSTIIEQECIDELAEYAGKRAEISSITERAMRGELDFEAALKERVAMLKGVPETALEETFQKRISLTPGARTLVQTMNKMGAVTALVSGGFTFFTDRIAAKAGFQTNQANELGLSNGILSGEVVEPILGRAAKLDALVSAARIHGVDLDQTLAVGDGANDLSMLESAGLGVAYHAKPAVAEAAQAQINHGDLTALLYLQGVKRSEFTVA